MSQPNKPANAPAPSYSVELFFEEPPAIESAGLAAALQTRCPDLVPLPAVSHPDAFGFEYREHGHGEGASRVRARMAVLASHQAPDLAKRSGALSQSWNWPGAAAALERCRASLLVTDLLADRLPPLERLIIFQNAVVALLENYPCTAIHWLPTQQMVRPADFLNAVAESGGLVFVPGPVNVRLFELDDAATNAGPVVLMDTLGLAALGLEDLQCRFRGLDPKAVAKILYNTAIYLLERGAVIDEGHTIDGLTPGEKWEFHRSRSFALPDRSVLSLAPASETPAETPSSGG